MTDRLRVAIVYDCLYPHTIGGAERWYRSLAVLLAQHHEITYLTRTQWRDDEKPDVPTGVNLVSLGAYSQLYTRSGRRRIAPPLSFGRDILLHLLRNRDRYDVVHTCSFPYFPMLFASALARVGGPPVVTDWFEVWPRDYWIRYIGGAAGRIGSLVQSLCIKSTGLAFVFADSTATDLCRSGYSRKPIVLRGMLDQGSKGKPTSSTSEYSRVPLAVYVGRHILEKRVTAIPEAIAIAQRQIPGLRAIIFGDGPERPRVLMEIARLGLTNSIECPGFVERNLIDDTLARAMCLVLPSEREGYGLVILEAAECGVPSIVVQGPNNAAVAFIENGVNGYVSESAEPAALARAIVNVHDNAPSLALRTLAWFENHKSRFLIAASLRPIEEAYRRAIGGLRNERA